MWSQRASSPKGPQAVGNAALLSPPQGQSSFDESLTGCDRTITSVRPATGPGGVVRMSSGNPRLLTAQRSPSPPHGIPLACSMAELAESIACWHPDCRTCLETRRRGLILCRLPCGHVVRAQVMDADSHTNANCIAGFSGQRAESPSAAACQQPDREGSGNSAHARSIVRQVSLVRSPVPSVGILTTLGNSSQHPPAPLSPPRRPASPSSPQQTPGTMYRKAPSSLTNFCMTREGTGHSGVGDGQLPQQMTSRSSTGGGSTAPSGSGPLSRCVSSTCSEKPRKHTSDAAGWRADAQLDGRAEGRRHASEATVAEVVTDSRGDVLHRTCNVILLGPQTPDREQQLKVRGQIIGTYWDERDIGPPLCHPGEVQVMVTYVDPSERSVALLFPTKHAQTFGDTETAEGNLIKWKAALCKVGKKFA